MLAADGRSPMSTRSYAKAEKIADGFIHVIGLVFAGSGAGALLVLASRSANWSTISTMGVYAVSLVVALAFSAAYNMWPVSRTKWMLRRCDQAAIFLLIGGTYTAFLTQASDDAMTIFAMAAIWTVAILGMLLKLALPGRFDRLSIAAYLTLGWSGLIFVPSATRVLPGIALCLVVLGGLLYSAGVIFHLWERLRFQNAIWHAFVLVAAVCQYGAVIDCLLLAHS